MKKTYGILVCLPLLLIGCGGSSSKPWNGFATNKATGKLEWWFTDYESHSDCMKHMYWEINNDAMQKENYKEPYGCAFMSNSFLDAVLRNELVADKEYFECLAESKNPDAEQIKVKYSVVLHQKEEKQCVPNTTFDVVWVGRFAKNGRTK